MIGYGHSIGYATRGKYVSLVDVCPDLCQDTYLITEDDTSSMLRTGKMTPCRQLVLQKTGLQCGMEGTATAAHSQSQLAKLPLYTESSFLKVNKSRPHLLDWIPTVWTLRHFSPNASKKLSWPCGGIGVSARSQLPGNFTVS